MKNLGLVGKNISHSKSQEMYERILGEVVNYHLFDYQESSSICTLESLFEKYSLEGLSITAPYKKHFINEVRFLDEDIAKIGLINCIGKKGSQFFATNTDLSACIEILDKMFEWGYENFILLGSGAMAEMTDFIFKKKKKELNQFSRREYGDLTYLDLSYFEGKTLVINATSREFVFKGRLPKGATFWDYNYSHLNQEKEIKEEYEYIDGIELLELQARHALKFWSALS